MQDLEKRVDKCSFILKTLLSRWNSLGNSVDETVTYKMVQEALDMLEGRFHEYETINIDIDDKTFLSIAKMAHEKDITFNQMVEMSLREHAMKTIDELGNPEENEEDINSEEE